MINNALANKSITTTNCNCNLQFLLALECYFSGLFDTFHYVRVITIREEELLSLHLFYTFPSVVFK